MLPISKEPNEKEKDYPVSVIASEVAEKFKQFTKELLFHVLRKRV